MTTPADQLAGVRRLLSKEEDWVKGALAAPNNPDAPSQSTGVQRCLLGARFCSSWTLADLWFEGDDEGYYDCIEESEYASTEVVREDPACQVLIKVIREQFPERAFDLRGNALDDQRIITNFNDFSSTRHEDVLRVLDKAVLEAGGSLPIE